MKKMIMMAVLALGFFSCTNQPIDTASESKNEHSEKETLKTAYIDTERLVKDYQQFKDFESKFKSMSDRMQEELERDAKRFQRDVMDLQQNAQSKGMEWAQNRQAELERRQMTLAEKEQNFMRKFQEESAVERDSMVSQLKDFIKDYGKNNGFDYIFGTGDIASVLYAKDTYDLTEEILNLLNKQYEEKNGKKEEPKKEETKEEENK